MGRRFPDKVRKWHVMGTCMTQFFSLPPCPPPPPNIENWVRIFADGLIPEYNTIYIYCTILCLFNCVVWRRVEDIATMINVIRYTRPTLYYSNNNNNDGRKQRLERPIGKKNVNAMGQSPRFLSTWTIKKMITPVMTSNISYFV